MHVFIMIIFLKKEISNLEYIVIHVPIVLYNISFRL